MQMRRRTCFDLKLYSDLYLIYILLWPVGMVKKYIWHLLNIFITVVSPYRYGSLSSFTSPSLYLYVVLPVVCSLD